MEDIGVSEDAEDAAAGARSPAAGKVWVEARVNTAGIRTGPGRALDTAASSPRTRPLGPASNRDLIRASNEGLRRLKFYNHKVMRDRRL